MGSYRREVDPGDAQLGRHNWPVIALLAFVAIAVEGFYGFGLWFAPGWANRWPGGLSIHVVWPAGMTAVAAAMLMTAAVGVGAAVAAGYQSQSGEPPSRLAVRLWLAVATLLTALASAYIFMSLRAETLAMWPNGYNP